MRGIRHTAGSGSQRLPPDAEFPKPLPDKPVGPGDHRASRRVFRALLGLCESPLTFDAIIQWLRL
jgi:hypothetical protein